MVPTERRLVSLFDRRVLDCLALRLADGDGIRHLNASWTKQCKRATDCFFARLVDHMDHWRVVRNVHGLQNIPSRLSESLAVSNDSLFYDSSRVSPIVMMMPFQFGARSNLFDAFNRIFRKRRLQQFIREDFSGFVFENSGTKHRLYFDDGAYQIIVGEFLGGPDRE